MSAGKARVGIIVQRYGEHVIGGAESHARMLAQRLVKDCDWEVHVLATTAKDSDTWRPWFAAGMEWDDGVLIHRFHVSKIRSRFTFGLFNAIFAGMLRRLGRRNPTGRIGILERTWHRLQGPYSPTLLNHLQRNQSQFDAVIFFSFHYHPTVIGLLSSFKKKILVPGLQDVSPAFFRSTKRIMASADHIAVNSEEELALLRRLYPVESQKAQIVAIGLDERDPTTLPESPLSDLPEQYVLYLGRVSRGKQVDRLVRHFEAFKREKVDNDIHLVLAGETEGGLQIPDAPYFHYLGFVSDAEKNYLIKRAMCVVNCSPMESLSLVTLEALRVGTPILVNELSETLRYYMKWAPTVFGYRNEQSFIQQLQAITGISWHDNGPRAAQLANSRKWVLDAFSWKRVTEYFRGFVGVSSSSSN